MSHSQESSAGGRVTRIDAAHPIRSQETASVEPSLAGRQFAGITADEIPAHVGEQLQTQAGQLARHLRARQEQIDHREAQLNARIAQLEHEVRTSRLWFAEREEAYLEREREWEQEIQKLHRKIQAFSASEISAHAEIDAHRAELREREASLDAREHRLGTGQMQLAEEAESLRVAIERLRSERAKHARQIQADQQQLEHHKSLIAEQQQRLLTNLARHRDTLDEREMGLDQQRRELGIRSQREIDATMQAQQQALRAAAALLDEQSLALEQERQEFETQREVATGAFQQERELFETRQREAELNFARLRDKLSARQATVDQRRVALEQMKQQVFELHRETIEMRMVAEQLWQHAAKGTPIAELTRSLGALRAKLVDEFRVTRDELADKEQHLCRLADKLDQRRQQLKTERAELNQWLERRNAAMEEQAARLVAREIELDNQQQAIREREVAWRAERRALEARLRQFAQQWRPHTSAAA